MFSKKPQLALQAASAASSASGGSRLKSAFLAPISNPYLGAGGAALLLLASVAALLLIGDPKAGAPSIRVALTEPKTDTPGVQVMSVSEAEPADPLTASLDGAATSESPTEAVVTLPSGERQSISMAGRQGLAPAPIAGLIQGGPGGNLPIIAADGRTPAQAYARPFTANGKPRVAIVIGALGIDPTATRKAIETLPPEVTLSFALYADDLQGWINMARSYGHEVLIEAPMEPKSFPQDDPGPNTLMANARPEDTLKKLDAILARGSGYFGLANYMGSKFLTSSGAVDTFTGGLRKRGLAFIDDGTALTKGGGIPRASADKIIDEQPGADAIGRRLADIETAATKRGYALGSGIGYPVTVSEVSRWAATLQSRGYQLAPASAVAVKR